MPASLRPFTASALLALLALFCPLLGPAAQAQGPRLVQHLTAEQGLSHRVVNCLLQDSTGFLWFGTDNGLDRYDGHRLQAFDQMSPSSLPHATIRSLLQDRAGTIWVGTEAGLLRYVPKTQRAEPLHLSPVGQAELAVRSLTQTPDHHLWAGLQSGHLVEFTAQGRVLNRYGLSLTGGRPLSPLMQISALPDGSLLLETYAGAALRVNRRGQLLRAYARPDQALRLVEALPGGQLLLASGNQLLRASRHDTALTVMHQLHAGPVPRYPVMQSVTDYYGQRWVGTTLQSLLQLPPHGADVRPVWSRAVGAFLEGNAPVNALLSDRSGHVWVATNQGVLQFDARPARFIAWAPPRQLWRANQLFSTRALLALPGGDLFASSYAGLFRRDAATGNWQQLPLRSPDGRDAAPYSLWADGKGSLWVGTEGAGLMRYDLQLRRFVGPGVLYGAAGVSPEDFIISLLPRPNGLLWVGSYVNLRLFDPKAGRYIPLPSLAEQLGRADVKVWALTPAPDGGAWVGSSLGLLRVDSAGRLLPSPSGGPSADVLCLWNAPGKYLWMGTRSSGLWCLDPRTGRWRNWHRANGLPDELVCSLQPEGDSALWLGTQRGLSRLRLAEASFTTYSTADGLAGDEFNHGSSTRLPDGRLLFGGTAGVSVVQPGPNLRTSSAPAPVLLTGLSYFDGQAGRFVERAGPFPALSLGPADQLLTLLFSLADFQVTSRHQYSYQLAETGQTGQWVPLGNEPSLRLATLPAGHYQLRVRGAGPDGRWSPQELRLELHVRPPFYRTVWFAVLVLLVFGGLGYGLYRYRLRRALALERLRTQIAANLHDEVGSLLTRIAVQAEFLTQMPAAASAPASLRNIADTSRAAVASMSDVVWSIDSRQDTLDDLLSRMREQLLLMLGPHDIAWEMSTDPQLRGTLVLPRAVRQNLYLIFKEALNNVVRHARARQVQVQLQQQDRTLVLTVRNDGSPLDEQAPRWPTGGQGLRNMNLRAQQLDGTVTTGALPGGGWQVELRVPR